MNDESHGISFGDFDVERFWQQSDYATKEYDGGPVTDHLVKQVERRLGYPFARLDDMGQ